MSCPHALTVEERLCPAEALLRDAWCAIDGDAFEDDRTNNNTVMRFPSMAMDEVKALDRLPAEVTSIEC
jgi:hypothetical protein